MVSVDGHPVRGAFTFRVGGRGSQAAVAAMSVKLLVGGASRPNVSALATLFRAISYVAMALLLGAAAHVFLVDPSPVRQTARLIRAAMVIAGVAGAGSLLLYGPLVTGQSFGAIADLRLLKQSLGDRVGRALAMRTIANLAPARDVVARPVSLSIATQTGLVDVTIDPGKRGLNTLHIYAMTKGGEARRVQSLVATLSNADAGIDSLQTDVVRAGPNHFQALSQDIAIGGVWRLDIAIRIDTFTEETGSALFSLK